MYEGSEVLVNDHFGLKTLYVEFQIFRNHLIGNFICKLSLIFIEQILLVIETVQKNRILLLHSEPESLVGDKKRMALLSHKVMQGNYIDFTF